MSIFLDYLKSLERAAPEDKDIVTSTSSTTLQPTQPEPVEVKIENSGLPDVAKVLLGK